MPRPAITTAKRREPAQASKNSLAAALEFPGMKGHEDGG